MVYATRSRVLAQRRGASGGTVSTARALGEKETPRKRRSSTHLESVVRTKKGTAAPSSGVATGRAVPTTTRSKRVTATTVTRPSGRRAIAAVGVPRRATKTAATQATTGSHQPVLADKDPHNHHLRFKGARDADDSRAGGGRRHRAGHPMDDEMLVGVFEPSVQSNRESRRENPHPNRHHHTPDTYPAAASINAASGRRNSLEDYAAVPRTHIHFGEKQGDSLGSSAAGYKHDHTDRVYMSGELSDRDDCVPTSLKRVRTMLETFEEGREFVGRDWHFEGEGKECTEEEETHHLLHKSKSKNKKNKKDAHEKIDLSSQPGTSASTSAPVSKWRLQSAFGRLSSFLGANSSSKDESSSVNESLSSSSSSSSNIIHVRAVEETDGPRRHTRWLENSSDTESDVSLMNKNPAKLYPLHSALKDIHKKRVPGRHVTYRADVRGSEDDDEGDNTLEDRDAEGEAPYQADTVGHRLWPILRLGQALRQFRSGSGNGSTSNAEAAASEGRRRRSITTTAVSHAYTPSSPSHAPTQHGPVQHLDQEVTLLKRLLREKDEALRSAEAARSHDQHLASGRTETLTREIHDLEALVRDLRTQLIQQTQGLTAARQQLADTQAKGHDQVHLLEREIVALNQTNLVKLRDKEAAENEVLRVQQLLEDARDERALIMEELHQLVEERADKESQLAAAQHRASVESQHAQDLAVKLEASEEELAGLRQQLLQTLDELNTLTAAEAREERTKKQLEAVQEEIRTRERYMRALEKTNASMGRKSNEVDRLEDEVQHLKDQLVLYEHELDEARNMIDELIVSRDRAAVLTVQVERLQEQVTQQKEELKRAREQKTELEHAHDQAEVLAARVIDLEDQVTVEEKHLTYLEDVALRHENCVADAQQLADRILELEEQVEEKNKELRRLEAVEEGALEMEEQMVSLQEDRYFLQEELQSKTHGLKELQSKYGRDTAKLESVAQQLRTEKEDLLQQLADKTERLRQANQVKGQLGQAQQDKRVLSDTIDRLNEELDRKETLLEKTEETLAQLRQDMDKGQERLNKAQAQNRELRDKVKQLERDASHVKRDQSKTAEDLAKASSSASQLVVQVAALNDQIASKEAALAQAEQQLAQLGQKQQQTQDLQSRIQDLETEAADNLTRAHVAEHEASELEERANRVYGLEKEVRGLQNQLEDLQNDLDAKEAELAALQKVVKQHDLAKRNIDELKNQVRQLKDLLKTAQAKAKDDIRLKDGEIHDLQSEIQSWVEHEAEWIQRTMDLTSEIERASQVARDKDKQLAETKIQMHDQEVEADRQKLVRKRRAAETEDRLRHKMRKLEREKQDVTSRLGLLTDENVRLTKSVELQSNRETYALELQEHIRELLLWRENSIAQTEEWETTVMNLEKDKTQLAKELVEQEKLVKQLQEEADQSSEWREQALVQAERLTAMVLKLEKELKRLQNTLAEHDAKDASLHNILHSYKDQIAKLEGTQASLHKQVRERDTTIADLKVQLQHEIVSYQRRLEDVCREGQAGDAEISRLRALLTEKERSLVEFNEYAEKGRALVTSLQVSLKRQEIAMKEQENRFNSLLEKHETVVQQRATQERQIHRLEKQLAESISKDSDKLVGQQAHIRKLEKQLSKSQARIGDLEVELHKAATSYHDTLILLDETNARLKGMVPAADANHDDCAARVEAGEREVDRLTREVENLQDRIIVLGREAQVKAQAWAKTEAEYKNRIEHLVQAQRELEVRAQETQQMVERERQYRDNERVRLVAEHAKNGELLQQLRRHSAQWEKEYSEMEMRMRREMTSTKDLMAKLATLRKSMVNENQAELRALDELEKELVLHANKVEETITFSRSRLDSGAFMDAGTIAQVQQQYQPSLALAFTDKSV